MREEICKKQQNIGYKDRFSWLDMLAESQNNHAFYV